MEDKSTTGWSANYPVYNEKGERVYAQWENIAAMDAEITQLKADLAKYGGHTAECAIHADRYVEDTHGHFSVRLGPHKCDCGFAEAQERWG